MACCVVHPFQDECVSVLVTNGLLKFASVVLILISID